MKRRKVYIVTRQQDAVVIPMRLHPEPGYRAGVLWPATQLDITGFRTWHQAKRAIERTKAYARGREPQVDGTFEIRRVEVAA